MIVKLPWVGIWLNMGRVPNLDGQSVLFAEEWWPLLTAWGMSTRFIYDLQGGIWLAGVIEECWPMSTGSFWGRHDEVQAWGSFQWVESTRKTNYLPSLGRNAVIAWLWWWSSKENIDVLEVCLSLMIHCYRGLQKSQRHLFRLGRSSKFHMRKCCLIQNRGKVNDRQVGIANFNCRVSVGSRCCLIYTPRFDEGDLQIGRFQEVWWWIYPLCSIVFQLF